MSNHFTKWLLTVVIYLSLPVLLYSQKQNIPKENIFIVVYSEELFSGVKLNDVQVAMDMWAKELEEVINNKLNIHLKGKSIFLKKDGDIRDFLLRNNPDLLTISALSYLKIRDIRKWKPIFCGDGIANIPGKSLFLLIKRNSGYSCLKDLKGKVIALPLNKRSRLVKLWLDNILLQDQCSLYTEHFGTVQQISKASNAVLDLFFGKIDACVVDEELFQTMSELNPQLSKSIRIFRRSAPLVSTIVCLNRDLDKNIQQEVYHLAKHFTDNTKGRQLLKLFGSTAATEYEPKYLQSLIDLTSTHDKLLEKYRQ